MRCGGIDIGGTKIEARLFDGPGAETVTAHRVPTPRDDFATFVAAIAAQVAWLEAHGGRIPVGLSLAGVVDPETGICFASNVPSSGHALAPALARAAGRDIPIVNDCMAFAYSEAHGGAGDGAQSVMGLILGTGVGGGFVLGGSVPHRHAGLAVEVGHLGLSARARARHDLPLFACGCGQTACMETYISGTGLANLAEWRLGRRLSGEALVAAAAAGDSAADAVLALWADLAGDCLYGLQIMLDPAVIVLGGGLSNMPDITDRLTTALAAQRLGGARMPKIARARHGDSSGARGAALIARETWTS